MSSLRRIESSRANGAISRGPNTPEGKARSSQNAQTHGLTANSVVLTNESTGFFQAVLDGYTAHFQPTGPLEHDLVEEMAVAKWRQRRLWSIETAALDLEMDRQEDEIASTYENLDEPTRLALAFQSLGDNSHILSNLSRYESRHRRAYQNALERLNSKRGKNEPSPISEHLPGELTEPLPPSSAF